MQPLAAVRQRLQRTAKRKDSSGVTASDVNLVAPEHAAASLLRTQTPRLPAGLLIGINAVTRALEEFTRLTRRRNPAAMSGASKPDATAIPASTSLASVDEGTSRDQSPPALILVCTTVQPPLLIAHLAVLSHLSGVPVLPLAVPSSALGATVGVATVVALSFPQRESWCADLVRALLPLAAVCHVPWLTPHALLPAASPAPTATVEVAVTASDRAPARGNGSAPPAKKAKPNPGGQAPPPSAETKV